MTKQSKDLIGKRSNLNLTDVKYGWDVPNESRTEKQRLNNEIWELNLEVKVLKAELEHINSINNIQTRLTVEAQRHQMMEELLNSYKYRTLKRIAVTMDYVAKRLVDGAMYINRHLVTLLDRI